MKKSMRLKRCRAKKEDLQSQEMRAGEGFYGAS